MPVGEEDETQTFFASRGASSKNEDAEQNSKRLNNKSDKSDKERRNTGQLTDTSFAEQNPIMTDRISSGKERETSFYNKKRLPSKTDENSQSKSKFPMISGPNPTKVAGPPQCCCFCFSWK